VLALSPTQLSLQTFIFGCFLWSAAFAAEADASKPDASKPNALEVLTRMQSVSQKQNYHGTLVFLQDGRIQSMSMVHQVDKNGEFERLVNLNGAPREVVRKNDTVVCYLPENKEVVVSRQTTNVNVLSQLAVNDFSQLQKNYQFTSEAVERVAGRDAQRILIKPKDDFRYGYRLWIDTENAILLKSDLLDVKGQSLEQTMFADITVVDHIPERLLKPTTTGDDFTWYQYEEPKGISETHESDWKIPSLPDGFAVSTRFHHQMPGSKTLTEHWVISDGLASISVYFEDVEKGKETFEGASPMGVTNAFGIINAGHQVTVIGEVPMSTVEKLARSVVYAASTDE